MTSNRTVLVVEDDPDSRAAVCEALRREGYAIVEAGHGREALDYLLQDATAAPSAIVLDLEMPVMTGWELLKLLKSYHRLASIPVVVLSGREAPAEALVHASVVKHVAKPCDPIEVAKIVSALGLNASGIWRTPG